MPLHAGLDDVDDPLRLGDLAAGAPPARYIGSAATLVRLYAGRPLGGPPTGRRVRWREN